MSPVQTLPRVEKEGRDLRDRNKEEKSGLGEEFLTPCGRFPDGNNQQIVVRPASSLRTVDPRHCKLEVERPPPKPLAGFLRVIRISWQRYPGP